MKKIEFCMMSLTRIWNLRTAFNTLTPFTFTLVIIDRIFGNKLKHNYLQNRQYFLKVLLHFKNLDKILRILKRSSSSLLQHARSYSFRKMKLLECLETDVLEHPLEINFLRSPKHCWSMRRATFTLMFH